MTLSKKAYQQIGHIVVNHYPELAQKLIPYTEPSGETDFSLIPKFFKRFCEIMQINPLEHTGPVYRFEKMEIRRLFLGVIAYIYNRHIFLLQPGTPISFKRSGFFNAISNVLNSHPSQVIRQVEKVIFYQQQFPELREQIISIASILNPQTDGKTESSKD